MAQRYSKYIPFISLTGDYMLLNLIFVFGFWFVSDVPAFSAKHVLFYLYLNIVWLVLVILFGAFRIKRNTHKKAILITYFQIIIFFFFLFLMYFQVVSLTYFPRDKINFLFPVFFALLIAWKFVLYYLFLYYRKWGYNYRNVIIIGHTPKSSQLFSYFSSDMWNGYRCLGIVCDPADGLKNSIGGWEDLPAIILNQSVDEVYLVWDGIPKEKLSTITETLIKFPLNVRIVPDLSYLSYKTIELTNYGTIPVIEIHPGPLSYLQNKLLKRFFDLIVSSIIIVSVLSWLTPILFLINLFTDRKGVFFLQKRTSFEGRVFLILKYRSMKINNQADYRKASEQDERVTVIGKFLRKTSIDELPQFINVFLGQMSVIGPRPHMLKHTDEYRQIVKHFMLRHTVKPGITGLAQINGYRGEIKKPEDIKRRVELDVQYIENWSFTLDLKILLLTFWVLLKGQKEAY